MSICIRPIFQTAVIFLLVASAGLGVSSAHAADGVSIEGQLTNPNGTALENSVVTFRIQVRSPGSENCLMFEDTHVLNMSGTGGNFKLKIGDGGTPSASNTYPLRRVFANRAPFTFTSALCATGTAYTPSSSDTRNVVVSFQVGGSGSFETLPTMNLGVVPFAFEAAQIAGFDATSLVRVMQPDGTLGNISPLSNSQYSELLSLVNGTSSGYERSGRLNGITLPTLSPGQILEWSGATWVARNRLDGIQTFAMTALPNCVGGQMLTSDGMSLSCVALPTASTGNAPDGSVMSPAFGFASSPNTGIYQPTANSIGFSAGGTEVARFDVSGNVGIGTAAPQGKLHVFSSGGSNLVELQTPTRGATIGLHSVAGLLFDTHQIAPITFNIQGTERMRIDNGRVGIGTNFPQGALHVANGAIVGASTGPTGSAVDFAAGNVLYTNNSCQAFTMYNLKPGTVYKFAVLGTTMSNCTFNAYTDNGATPLTQLGNSPYTPNAGSRVIFAFTVLSNGQFIVEPMMF